MSPSIGILLNGVLIPNLLNNPLASWCLINLHFLLRHIAHFDNVITLPLLLAKTFGFMFSVLFYILNNMIPLCTYALFVKYFKIISSFFLKLFGEKIFAYSVNGFPLNIKSINSVQKYPYITESYACILKMFFLMLLSFSRSRRQRMNNKCFNFFPNMLYSKTIKISNAIIIYVQNNPMSSNIRVFINIYYISPMLYCL